MLFRRFGFKSSQTFCVRANNARLDDRAHSLLIWWFMLLGGLGEWF